MRKTSRPRLGRIPMALALALCMQAAMAQTIAFDQPAQPLEQALTAFARQAGLQLVYPPDLVQGLRAPALRGSHSREAALAELLRGSGVGGRIQGRTLVLSPQAAPAPDSAVALPATVVRAQREEQGSTVLDRAAIRALPPGNGDIASVLRIHPNVQFSSTQQRGATQGEIAPADISINGARFYDNLFLVDGMSINSDIDPAGAGAAIGTPPSAAQGLAVDTSRLCNITVLDSNVGAEYGGFGGGVVSAETCAPTRRFGGEVSLEHTRSSWMQHKYAPGEAESAAQSADESAQPNFRKWTYRASAESRLNETFGLLASVTRKTSDIPLRGYANGGTSASDENAKHQSRTQESLYLRGFWTPAPGVQADLAFGYEPSAARMFIANARDSYYENRSGGRTLNAGLRHRLDGGVTLSHRLSGSAMQASRESDSTVWKLWRHSADKDWGVASSASAHNSSEGGWGDVEQAEKRLAYQLKAEAEPWQWGAVRHRLQGGLQLERQQQDYERLSTYEQYQVSANTTTCALASGGVDTEYCSMATPWNARTGGQYLRQRLIHQAGAFSVRNNSYAAYLQDELQWERLRLRLSLRYDHQSLAAKGALAPRAAGFWDVWGTGATVVEAGVNRYYSRNFMIYHSYRERLALQSGAQLRSLTAGGLIGDWADPVYGGTAAMYSSGALRLPYSDELTLGVSQSAWGAVWSAKYVRRKGRDEVVLHLRDIGDYWWDNVGRSEADVVSLKVATQRPLAWGGTRTSLMAAFDHTDVKTSHADYSDRLSSYAGDLDAMIAYQGRFIRYLDRPANNYNRPWTLRLMAVTEIPAARLTVSNLLRWRDGYARVAKTGDKVDYQGSQVDVWERVRFDKAITWDVQLNWRLPTRAQEAAYVNLAVENVLNRSNVADGSAADAPRYEKGRQVWLRVGYQF